MPWQIVRQTSRKDLIMLTALCPECGRIVRMRADWFETNVMCGDCQFESTEGSLTKIPRDKQKLATEAYRRHKQACNAMGIAAAPKDVFMGEIARTPSLLDEDEPEREPPYPSMPSPLTWAMDK